MSGLRLTYLGFTILGAIWPMLYFFAWLGEPGHGPSSLVLAWLANDATTGLALDLVIAGTVLTIWILAETRVRRNWSALWAIPAIFCIGVSCGLPLYLFLRTRPV